MEWLRLFATSLIMAALLIAPGYVAAYGSFNSRSVALSVSPSLSIALYVLAGVLLEALGFHVGALAVPAVALAIALLIFKIQGLLKRNGILELVLSRCSAGCDFNNLMLYVFVGVVVSFIYFFMCLDGANSFANASDSCVHLNYVRSFIETGTFSTFKVSSGPSHIYDAGFYPAAWHVLVAIASSFTNGSITMAANSVNFLILSVVYPSACALLLGSIFTDEAGARHAGALASACFVGFPWIFLVWGQLVSNMLGFALVPVFVFLFRELLSSENVRKALAISVPFLLTSIALVFSQPNSIYTGGIFCVPFIVKRVQALMDLKGKTKNNDLRSLVIVLSIVAAIWVAFYKAPFMRAVISVDWHPTNSIVQAVANAFFLAYGSLQTAQPLLALFVLLGFFRALSSDGKRPLCAVYSFCFLVQVANSTNGFPHSRVFAGFWYNDPYRTGAMLALASVPLACLGMSFCVSVFSNSVLGPCGRRNRKVVHLATTFVLVLALLFPAYELPGYGVRRTGFGSMSELLTSLYLHDNPEGIDSSEWAFLSKVQEIVGNDLVFNIPEDGSGVLYGVSGMNVLFTRYPAGTSSSRGAAALGECLSEIGTNAEACNTVRSLGIRYVMLLDCNADKGEGSVVAYANQPDAWKGVYSIDESTPGFKLLLSEGDMRLYKIEDDLLS